METKKDLRILHLEDVPEDAELVERQLRDARFPFLVQHAANRAEFVRALEEFHPDVILADYSLPDFDGLAAIQLARKMDPDLPIIVVTGVLGDEAAVSLIKAGANDYVIKDRLARLGSAVERAVEEAEQSRARRRAEAEILTLNAELERRVVARTAELQAANGLKDELIEHERAISVELERLRSRDVEVGLRIQQSLLLSQPPDVPGLRDRGAHRSLPADRRRLLHFSRPSGPVAGRDRGRRHGQGNFRGPAGSRHQDPVLQSPQLSAGGLPRRPASRTERHRHARRMRRSCAT